MLEPEVVLFTSTSCSSASHLTQHSFSRDSMISSALHLSPPFPPPPSHRTLFPLRSNSALTPATLMQSILLQRRLKTRYSLLVPFPPLPFAYPPPLRPEELRVRTGSPPSHVTRRESQVQDGVQMHEMGRPDGPARSTAEAEADPFARWDAIEEIPPSSDQSATLVKLPTASSGPPPEEEVFIVEFSKLYDPLNPQASFPGLSFFRERASGSELTVGWSVRTVLEHAQTYLDDPDLVSAGPLLRRSLVHECVRRYKGEPRPGRQSNDRESAGGLPSPSKATLTLGEPVGQSGYGALPRRVWCRRSDCCTAL